MQELGFSHNVQFPLGPTFFLRPMSSNYQSDGQASSLQNQINFEAGTKFMKLPSKNRRGRAVEIDSRWDQDCHECLDAKQRGALRN